MGYYNWEEIAASKTDNELLAIYKDQDREPKEKVDAAIKELQKRNVLSQEQVLINRSNSIASVIELSEIKETRANLPRAKAARALIIIVLIMEIFCIISSYAQYNLIQRIQNGEYVSDIAINNNDFREAALGLIYFALSIASAITFILWFRRAYYNLHRRYSGCDFTDGWASGSWFVPIISLFRPYQIMKELWKKTNRILEKRNIDTEKLNISILGFWWFLWITTTVIGNILFRTTRNAETLNAIKDTTLIDMVNSIIGIPLALITIIIINKYAKKEELLYESEISNLS